jgi:multidrug transporter EmrE-like cation transporter
VCYLAGALFGVSIFFSINATFYFCHRAGLNIGIAATIWGFTAILASIMDYSYFGTQLKKQHILGLLCMLVAVWCISLSPIFEETNEKIKQSG